MHGRGHPVPLHLGLQLVILNVWLQLQTIIINLTVSKHVPSRVARPCFFCLKSAQHRIRTVTE